MESDGSMLVELGKYLYGLPQAAARFQVHLSDTLILMGFKISIGDRCAFIRGTGRDKVVVTTHVDDLGVGARTPLITYFLTELQKYYSIRTQRGEQISYLGLNIIVQPDGARTIDQGGYRKEITRDFAVEIQKCTHKPVCPSSAWLLKKPPVSDPPTPIHRYTSAVMKVMWLARLTGYHLLWTTTYLSSQCKNPTNHYYRALCQLLRFISDEGNICIRFACGPEPKLGIYVDAAHAQHHDGKGHYSIIVMFGGGYICARLSKIPCVDLYPLEAEHYGMSEAITYAVWARQMIKELGGNTLNPTRIGNDNTAVIAKTSGDESFSRSKHMRVRQQYVREHRELGTFESYYVPGPTLPTNMGTKPETATAMKAHMKTIGLRTIDFSKNT